MSFGFRYVVIADLDGPNNCGGRYYVRARTLLDAMKLAEDVNDAIPVRGYVTIRDTLARDGEIENRIYFDGRFVTSGYKALHNHLYVLAVNNGLYLNALFYTFAGADDTQMAIARAMELNDLVNMGLFSDSVINFSLLKYWGSDNQFSSLELMIDYIRQQEPIDP